MRTSLIIVNHGTTDRTEAKEGLHRLHIEMKRRLPQDVRIYSVIMSDIVLDYARRDNIRRIQEERIALDTDSAGDAALQSDDMSVALHDLPEICRMTIQNGTERLIVFPTIMLEGALYDKVLEDIHRETYGKIREVRILPPVLNADERESTDRLARMIEASLHLDSEKQYILIGYETDYPMQQIYQCLQDAFRRDGFPHVHIASLNDREGISRIAAEIRQDPGTGPVIFQPLTTNAKGHLLEEDRGDTRRLAEMFRKYGFEVRETRKGLACYPEYRDALIRKALQELSIP